MVMRREHFFFVIGGDGGAIIDAALGGGHFGGMQQSGDQSGLAAVRMPHYSYVADLTSLVRFHGVLLRLPWGRWPSAGPRQEEARKLSLGVDWRSTARLREG